MSTADQSPPRTVYFAVFDTLADWELGYVAGHLGTALTQVGTPGRFAQVTVGLSALPVVTLGGVRVVPDAVLADVSDDDGALVDAAMLVLPGGDVWEHDPEAVAPFVRAATQAVAAGVPVAAICGATHALAVAGVLDTVAHTSNSPEFLAATGYAGAELYVDEPAVTGGGVITASGAAPVHFAREVFTRLEILPPPMLDAWFATFAHQDRHAFARLLA